jgi:hypothetical protein
LGDALNKRSEKVFEKIYFALSKNGIKTQVWATLTAHLDLFWVIYCHSHKKLLPLWRFVGRALFLAKNNSVDLRKSESCSNAA